MKKQKAVLSELSAEDEVLFFHFFENYLYSDNKIV